jgi:hypothetical protein
MSHAYICFIANDQTTAIDQTSTIGQTTALAEDALNERLLMR